MAIFVGVQKMETFVLCRTGMKKIQVILMGYEIIACNFGKWGMKKEHPHGRNRGKERRAPILGTRSVVKRGLLPAAA